MSAAGAGGVPLQSAEETLTILQAEKICKLLLFHSMTGNGNFILIFCHISRFLFLCKSSIAEPQFTGFKYKLCLNAVICRTFQKFFNLYKANTN